MKLRQLHVKLGMCSLNNDPLDFRNNFTRIMKSIELCKSLGCLIRIGAELEVPGYGCNDHFLEYDTTYHSWDVIKDIILSGITDGIVCEVGCPILHKSALYNGRVILFNSKVVAIRAKMILADGSNYFQTRYFAFWSHSREVGEFKLPLVIQEVTKQHTVPIGSFIIDFNDTSLAYEICEESWISNNPMIDAALDGAQIFINCSASEMERGKLRRKLQMLEEATQRHGGAYAYVNLKGALGDRNYFDGGCIFAENGKVKELSDPFSLEQVSVTPVIVNLNSIRTFRLNNKSFQKMSHSVSKIPRVSIPINVATNADEYRYDCPTHKSELLRKRQIYEFPHATYEPSAYLWDILRKSKAKGFFLPLSGGVDSCCVSLVVYNMCDLVYRSIQSGKPGVLLQLRQAVGDPCFQPISPREICSKLLYTCYMATKNSSEATQKRSRKIADGIGSNHRLINFDSIYDQYQKIAQDELGIEAKFLKEGGTWRTDVALQNIQARSRMVLAYFLAQMELEKAQQPGFLLVLGSSNLDESLRGYFTKYDCSSADYNPIGSFSKGRIKEMLLWAASTHNFDFITEILTATPTAELQPLKEGQVAQSDEEDMGLTYEDLGLFGHLRKVERLGPVLMFDRAYSMQKYPTAQILRDKIKKFFVSYGINRHKCTTLTPSLHFDPEGCDDNRFDMRPFLYATDWAYQFEVIDERVNEINSKTLHPSCNLATSPQ